MQLFLSWLLNLFYQQRKPYMTSDWVPVVFAHQLPPCELCGEPWCPQCENHYSGCECPGPTQDDEYEYCIVSNVLIARRKEN